MIGGPVWVAVARLLPPCSWRALTGWPCPGCGTTRALSDLLRADVTGALAHNPLVATGASVFLAGGLTAPAWLAAGGRVPVIDASPRPGWLAAAAAAIAANWVWLVAHGV